MPHRTDRALTADAMRLITHLRHALKERPTPLIVESDGAYATRVCPGGSLWTGAIEVAAALEAAGLREGDRLAVCLPNGIDFIRLMLGAMRAGITFCPVPHGSRYASEMVLGLDAALVVTDADLPGAVTVGDLLEGTPSRRSPSRPPTPDLAWILWTSGTGGDPRAIGLSAANLVHQIEGHAPALEMKGARVVSFLSWAHAFGASIELLQALVAGAEIELPCRFRYDRDALAEAVRREPGSWLNAVPRVIHELAELPDGKNLLRGLSGGVVGGAAIDQECAEILSGSRLRVGYGQTEASPGIMLGPRGVFSAGLLGLPVGCDVALVEGELRAKGANVAAEVWHGEPMRREGEWLLTGDLAHLTDEGLYVFDGRASGCWKWSNGRAFNPQPVEESLTRTAGSQVFLFKARRDSVQPVVIGNLAIAPELPLALPHEPPVVLPLAEAAECLTAAGKWSRAKLAEATLRLYPHAVELDPLHYRSVRQPLEIGRGTRLTTRELTRAAQRGVGARLSAATPEAVAQCHTFAQERARAGETIYGWKTGFGPLVAFEACDDPVDQGIGLLAHLRAGQGEPLEPEVVRAMLLLRAHTVAQGHSAISPACLGWLIEAIQKGVTPVVPRWGSVGASGDLVPMAHAVAALLGEGEMILGDRRVPAAEALSRLGLEPVHLAGRDALALVNGTPLMSAMGAFAIEEARRALAGAIVLTGGLYELLGAHHQPLAESLHARSGHETHEIVAAEIAGGLAGMRIDPTRPLQEPYSVRCAPQLLGAVLTSLRSVTRVLDDELNGVTDNPFFDAESQSVVHGGAFFGQEPAFALDTLTSAAVQLANLVERQLALILEPETNGGLPLLLAPIPGATSGLAGVQISATAQVAELRRRAMPASIQSLPTNGRNQDIVPMGVHAARNAFESVRMIEPLLGSLAVALGQGFFLQRSEPVSPFGRVLMAALSEVPPLDGADRPLFEDVRRASSALLSHPAIDELTDRLAA